MFRDSGQMHFREIKRPVPVVPLNNTLHRLPDAMPMQLGALVEPVAVACHDVRLGAVKATRNTWPTVWLLVGRYWLGS